MSLWATVDQNATFRKHLSVKGLGNPDFAIILDSLVVQVKRRDNFERIASRWYPKKLFFRPFLYLLSSF